MNALAQMLTGIVILAPLAVFLFRTRSRVSRCNTRPLNGAERVLRWQQKTDESIGLESETFLSQRATGSEAKKAMLADIATRSKHSRFAGRKTHFVEVMSRNGINSLQRQPVRVMALGSISKSNIVPIKDVDIVVRRPKLSLAR